MRVMPTSTNQEYLYDHPERVRPSMSRLRRWGWYNIDVGTGTHHQWQHRRLGHRFFGSHVLDSCSWCGKKR